MRTNWGVVVVKLFIGDQEVEFTEEDLDYMFIDEGAEAEVFKYGDEVLKIYKDYCRKMRLTEEDAANLSCFSTQRVLLPKKLLKVPGTFAFKGYTTRFIQGCSNHLIVDMNMEHFLSELEILEDDMKLLADHKVDVADFNLDNMLYDGSMYLCDPGSFLFLRGSKTGEIHKNNIGTLNDFILEDIFGLVKIGRDGKEKFMSYINNYDSYECLSEQVREKTVPGETIMQHVKRMIK